MLTFDVGTQSVRALLFDNTGTTVAYSQITYPPYYSDNPGWAEQHPDFYFEKMCEAAQELKKEQPGLWKEIAAVTVTTIRDTAVCLDKDLKPLRASILWMDRRKAVCEEPFPVATQAAFAIVGMTTCATESRRCTAANWIKENQPEIWEKTYRYVLLSGYLNLKLTGRLADSIASLVGHIPIDSKNGRWMRETDIKYWVFGVEKEKLCDDIVEPGDTVGTLTAEAAEKLGLSADIKLIATGADKSCEGVGTGCVDSSMAAISLGSAATIQITTDRYVEPQQFMPAYPSLMKGKFNPEIQIYRGYWMISWFKQEFAAEEHIEAGRLGIPCERVLDRRLGEIPAGCDGLLLQPFWGGGLKNPEGKGAILGFSDTHTRMHIYRAIVEGINYALRDGLLNMCFRAGIDIDAITVSGGGSRSDVVCQIVADMFGKSVYRAQTYETAGLGSSIVGFCGIGEFSSVEEGVSKMVHHTAEFKPGKDFELYNSIYWDVYRPLYSRLKQTYVAMADIYDRILGQEL